VIVIFNRRVCAGCLLAYPTALVVLILLQPSGYESIFFALLFALLSQLRRLSKDVIIQHLCRIVAGIALGFGVGGGYWAVINGQWFLVFVSITGAGLYVISKAYSITSKLNCGNTIVPDERPCRSEKSL
jgi:hypothetical protein